MFGMGGGGGGFLSGLGGKFQNMMHGTTPVLKDVTGPGGMGGSSNGIYQGREVGMIKPPISLEDTGQKTGGLLSKVRDPDSRGLTFSDKLFAAGSVLQGDSGGAATYIANQRNAADALNERERTRGIAERGAAAFSENLLDGLPDNFKRYARALGKDLNPESLMKMYQDQRTKYSGMSTANGGITAFDPYNPAGSVVVNPGEAAEPPKFVQGPNGLMPNPVWGEWQYQQAAAERRGKPQAPRVGRASGGGLGGWK